MAVAAAQLNWFQLQTKVSNRESKKKQAKEEVCQLLSLAAVTQGVVLKMKRDAGFNTHILN